jgi:hypothetical protein
MKNILIIASVILFSCGKREEIKMKTVEVVAELPEATSYPVELDMSKYAEDFVANCQTCHTPRYIEMQPVLSRKTWEKIVDKMIHSYGAPIDSMAATRIVNYLVWVKGN